MIRRVDSIITSRGLASYVGSIDPDKPVFECAFSGQDPQPKNEELAKTLGIFLNPTVVYTGNFAGYQGIELLIKAAALVRVEIPKVIFVLVGGTEFEIKQTTRLIEKNNLKKNVLLIPRVHRREIPAYFALADVLVLPRQVGQNAPFKIFDYLKSGKPIVATKIPAHTALLSDETSILIEPTPRGLAEGLQRALQDAGVAKRLASAAQNSWQIGNIRPLREILVQAYHSVIG